MLYKVTQAAVTDFAATVLSRQFIYGVKRRKVAMNVSTIKSMTDSMYAALIAKHINKAMHPLVHFAPRTSLNLTKTRLA